MRFDRVDCAASEMAMPGNAGAGQQTGDRHAHGVQHGDARKQQHQRAEDILKKAGHRLVGGKVQVVLGTVQ